MITLQGPVSRAAHGDSISPWFSIGVGVVFLTGLWIQYFKKREQTKVPIGSLLFLNAIGLVFIAIGLWGLFR